MKINLMPIPEPDRRIDLDQFVWIWNATNHSWIRTTVWTAIAFHEVYPERYTHWVEDGAIERPINDKTNATKNT